MLRISEQPLQATARATSPAAAPTSLRANTFVAQPEAAGASVLLIDDTWTTGATAQAAAAALHTAGATVVALVVLGRHVNPSRVRASREIAEAAPFSWDHCAADYDTEPRCSASHASTSLW